MKQLPKCLQPLFDKKKRENFLYYYKNYLILGAFFLVLLISLVVDTVKNSKPVFQLTYVNIPSSMQEELTQHCKEALPDADDRKVGTDPLYISDINTIAEQETVIYQIAARLTAGEIDVFVSEYEVYLQYAEDACFTDLQPYLSEEFLEAFSDRLLYSQIDGERHITGLLWSAPNGGKDYALSVPFSSQLQQSAAALIVSFVQKEGMA